MGSISTFEALTGDYDDFDAHNEKYQPSVYLNSQMYPVNPQHLEGQSHRPLKDRIVQFPTPDGFADYFIDGTIRVHAPSDVFRQKMVQTWTETKTNIKNAAWMGGFATFFTAAGAVITAPMSPIFMTAYIVASIASVIFTSVAIYKNSEGSEQIDLWKQSPANAVAEQRRLAYQNGFSFVYGNNLKISGEPSKTGVLHPSEVQFLYQKYFPSYCLKLLNSNPNINTRWMLDFLHHNPLSSTLINYAMGQTPPNLQAVSNDFTQLQTLLNDIQNHFSRLKAEVRTNASQTIDTYNVKREASLLPLRIARDHYMATARAERDEKLKDATEDERREATQTFNAASEKYELYYTLAATPINLYFDNQIQQTRVQRDQTIKELSSKESESLATYYPAARELLDRAYRVWTQPYMYQPLNFAQYGYHVPQPSAPTFSNLPNFQEQVYRQPPPADWNQTQQSQYQEYLNFLRMQNQPAW